MEKYCNTIESRPPTHAESLRMAKGGSDFPRYLAGVDQITRAQRNGRHASMPSAAIFLTKRREIHVRGNLFPRTGPHRDLCPHGRRAYSHGIDRVRVQKIRDELVVAFQ